MNGGVRIESVLHGFSMAESRNEKQQKNYEIRTCRRDDVCRFFRSSLRLNDFVPRSIGSCPRFSTVLDIQHGRQTTRFRIRERLFLLLRLFAPFIYRFMQFNRLRFCPRLSGTGVMSRPDIIAPAFFRIPVPTLLHAAASATKVHLTVERDLTRFQAPRDTVFRLQGVYEPYFSFFSENLSFFDSPSFLQSFSDIPLIPFISNIGSIKRVEIRWRRLLPFGVCLIEFFFYFICNNFIPWSFFDLLVLNIGTTK